MACLVLDVYLEGLSGFGLQKQLAAEGSRIPVLFITGRDDPSTRERARQAGAVDYLRKPLDEEVLLAAIQRAVDCWRVVGAGPIGGTMRRGLLLGAVLGGVVVLLGRGAPLVAQQSLTWTAGAVGGGWYAISNGMAELMREKTGLSIKVIPDKCRRADGPMARSSAS